MTTPRIFANRHNAAFSGLLPPELKPSYLRFSIVDPSNTICRTAIAIFSRLEIRSRLIPPQTLGCQSTLSATPPRGRAVPDSYAFYGLPCWAGLPFNARSWMNIAKGPS
jgi:hypothetical protein